MNNQARRTLIAISPTVAAKILPLKAQWEVWLGHGLTWGEFLLASTRNPPADVRSEGESNGEA